MFNLIIKLGISPFKFRWRASTLNPYFEGNSISNTILDDRLISQTLENWIFGEDYDGDILQEGNIRSLINYCKSLGEVNLVTGDGSIDCLDLPEHQEDIVSKLHMAELIVSLAILSDKGSLLLKMFTFYETSSICMLYVLNCCFDELHIFKPATSKEGNSEVYVIGIGFKKAMLSAEIIEKMVVNFKDQSKSLLPLDVIPQEFIKQVVEAARFFMNKQVAVIEGNIRMFKKYDKLESDWIKRMKHLLVEEYVNIYRVAPIREDQKLLHGVQINNDINLNVRVHSGSHSERMTFYHLSPKDQQQVLFDRLKHFYDMITENSLSTSCAAFRLPEPEMEPSGFINLIQGRSIEKVVSSKFLLVSIVKFLNEVRTFCENPKEEFKGKKINVEANYFIIKMDYFTRAESYDTYEKEVTGKFLNFLLENDYESFIVEGLPVFTQFLVGVVLYLSLFVFEESHLERSSSTITFRSFRINGKDSLRFLISTLNQSSHRTLLGICDPKQLFSLSQQFYKLLVDYNNHICLKFCSNFLCISNR